MAEITLNNRKREVAAGTTLAGLLEELRMSPEMVSVALNGVIIPREELNGHRLAGGETVEILMFMGGGAQ